MIDPTEDEISFLQKLVLRGGELTLQGNLRLLKIDRLIPTYITQASAGMDTGVFTLTEKGWELAGNIRGSEVGR
jgi:DNA-binding PadR family transcriptional regulator